ncbi:UrcA family protein [Caulobacter sp. KR2-114]|uniref:UrcA family protein n=1 Tax=Caulobacter sp. KR2-114 TaxID=3400912 RepID=UPI003BFB2FBA
MTGFNLSILGEALCGAAAGALALGLAVTPARAQDVRDGDTVEGVVVAPYGAHTDGHDGRANIGGPIEERPYQVSSARLVRYAELDLGSRRDAYRLKARIEDAARSACDQLGARPQAEDEDGAYCYADAVRDGMQQVTYDIGYTPRGW